MLEQGYIQADNIRQKFTGYERDGETGLDYAQARYYSNVQGRFISVDPLLSSGEVTQPQSWNRYTYTFNIPLRYADPVGLFVWSAALGGRASDDELLQNAGNDRRARRRAEQIIDKRTRFRNARTAARNAAANSDSPAEVLRAIDSYGTEHADNGVTVTFGATKPGSAAETGPNGQNLIFNNDGSVRASILVTINDNTSGDELTIAVAHEGQHAQDRQTYARVVENRLAEGFSQDLIAGSRFNPTVRQTETNAYKISSLVAQGLGQSNREYSGVKIWDSGWRNVDRATLRSVNIEKLITSSSLYKDKLDQRLFER